MITYQKATRDDLDYVWKHLRDEDRAELAISGLTDENYGLVIERATNTECAFVDGVPAAIRGYTIWPGYIVIGLFGTSQVNRMGMTLVRDGRRYVQGLIARFPGWPVMAEVDPAYARAVAWLKRIGFKETGHQSRYPTGTLEVMVAQPNP